MGRLGNIGGIEQHEAGPETRIAIEKLDRRLDLIERTSATVIRNNITIINNPPLGTNFPYSVHRAYPFVLTGSLVVPPTGWDLLPATAYRITYCEMHCDPEAAAPSANTSITLQNMATFPTATAIVTFASGTKRAVNSSMALQITASQRLFMKFPATLNGLQNLWSIMFVLNTP